MWTRPVGLGNEKQATSSCWGVRREQAFEGTGTEPVENGIPENSHLCGITERGEPANQNPFYRTGNSEKWNDLPVVTPL